MAPTRRSTTDDTLRTWQVAELLHVSPKTITRWAKAGKLPYIQTLGGHRRYPEDQIRALAARSVVTATNGPAAGGREG